METKSYSLVHGIIKSLKYAAFFGVGLTITVMFSNFEGVYNTQIVDIIYKYSSQIFGTMTVGGLLTFVYNYLKMNSNSNRG